MVAARFNSKASCDLVTSDELRVAELWWLRDLIQKQAAI
jgi:hypothetical protein